METLSPSTGSSSPKTLSPSTKASSVISTTDHDDNDINAWAAKATPNTQKDTANCGDCAGVAMKSLQDLALASSSPLLHPSSHIKNQLLEASSSIKYLSAVLICPCSRKPDISFLNAALCIAILDTYWDILRNIADVASTDRSSEIENMMTGSTHMMSPPMFNHHFSPADFGIAQSHSGRNQGYQQATIVQRVLDELPKAANVVMQFSRRYAPSEEAALAGSGIAGGKGEVVDLLPILANEQRVRLKGMVDQATDLMALDA
ncbi:MAG: hypothetical protein Q9192_005671 [Flavoplaca navasiana]